MGSIERIVEYCEAENEREGKLKYVLPKGEEFCFEEARELFRHPEVTDDYELKWERDINE